MEEGCYCLVSLLMNKTKGRSLCWTPKTSTVVVVVVGGLLAKLCPTLETPWLLCPWDFPGKNTKVSCRFLLQGIFLTQGLNLGLLHCRQILYWLSHQGSSTNTVLYVNYISIFKNLEKKKKIKIKKEVRGFKDFPNGPVVKIPCFHYKGQGFDPFSGN